MADKIRKYFLIGICIGLMFWSLIWLSVVLNDRAELKVQAIAYQTMKHEQEKISIMGRTLEIAYRMSEAEAWTRATIYNRFARNFRIEWFVFPAVAWIESRFSAYSLSEKGAIGEMQLLESTAKDVCNILKIKYKKNETIKDQIRNIHIGCTYLSCLITDKGQVEGIKRYFGQGEETNDYFIAVNGEMAKLQEIYKILEKGNAIAYHPSRRTK